MTDLTWPPPPPPDPTAIVTPKTCRRHQWEWTEMMDNDSRVVTMAVWCARCHRMQDVVASRRGRNSRSRGKRIERVEMRKAGVHTGNANKADDGLSADGMFSFQVKSRGAFPHWMTLELDKLRTAHGNKVPVLVVVEAPGPGHRPRKLAILEWSDWLSLHQGTSPTRQGGVG